MQLPVEEVPAPGPSAPRARRGPRNEGIDTANVISSTRTRAPSSRKRGLDDDISDQPKKRGKSARCAERERMCRALVGMCRTCNVSCERHCVHKPTPQVPPRHYGDRSGSEDCKNDKNDTNDNEKREGGSGSGDKPDSGGSRGAEE
ncbi:hypothetical protein C8F04DRAFT_1187035 [Mycena alexandri]|uniref:Uncharacterized protein n=1 Tax=Mycena alexandri TaxID=1745969 RepID=A0AAD6SQZ7_9AGAR|nr:hypothetical protein C8F04DRAFT_1187035 [Mycena alexandri]